MSDMIPAQIIGIHLERRSGAPVLLLGETDDDPRVLPILIGPVEARSIVVGASQIEPPRPATHDLIIDVLECLGAELDQVEVTELRDSTFIAGLAVHDDSGAHRISCRPSDAFALAARLGVPILVRADVLDQAGVHLRLGPDQEPDDDEIDRIVSEFQEFLSTADPADFGRPPSTDEPG